MNIKTILKSTGRWAALSIACLFLCTGILFAMVQTEAGKGYLARSLQSILSAGPERQVKIGRIRGLIPFDIQCDNISLGDKKREWLVLKRLYLKWRPLELIGGNIHIEELRTGAIFLGPIPENPGAKEEKKGLKSYWPLPVPPLFIERVRFDRFRIDKKVLGTDAVFSVKGSMISSSPVRGLSGYLRIDRRDTLNTFAEINWTVRGPEPKLRLDVKAHEAEGGLLKTMLGLNDSGPAYFQLTGEGTPEEWKGRLSFKAPKLADIESELELRLKKNPRIIGAGNIVPDPSVIPEQLSTLIQEKGVGFSFDMEYRSGRELHFKNIQMDTGISRIKINGSLDLDKQTTHSFFDFTLKDISAFKGIMHEEISGGLHVKGDLSGPIRNPLSRLSVSISKPEFRDFSAERIRSDIQIQASGKSLLSFQRMRTTGKGNIEGLRSPNKHFPIPFERSQWDYDMNIKRGSPIDIVNLRVRTEELLFDYSGTFDPELLSIDGKAGLTLEDLGRFSGTIGSDINARVSLNTRLKANLKDRDMNAGFEARIEKLKHVPSYIEPITRGGIRVRSQMTLADGEKLSFSDFKVSTAGSTVKGSGSINLVKGTIAADIHLSVPELRVISGIVEKEIDGALEMDLHAGGPYLDPKIRASASGKEIIIQGYHLPYVQISLQADNLKAGPRGGLGLYVRRDTYEINTSAQFISKKDHLILRDIQAAGAGISVAGDLELDLKSLIAEGSLKIKSDDLVTVSSILGERIEGSVHIDTLLKRGEKGQDVDIELLGKGLGARNAFLEQLKITSKIKDLFEDMKGQADLDLKSFQMGTVHLRTLRIEVEGRPGENKFSLIGNGEFPDPFMISTRGAGTFTAKENRLRLEQLQGRYGKIPFKLIRPLVLRNINHVYELEKTEFSVSKGILQSSGKLDPASIEFDTVLEEFPLNILRLFGLPDLNGWATAKINITGSRDRPEGNMEIHMRDIHSPDIKFRDIPPAQLMASASLKKGNLKGDLALDGLSEKTIEAVFQIPVSFTLSPVSISIARKGEIHGKVTAEIDISRIPVFFHMDDQVLDGDLRTDLEISGSIEKPDIKGALHLSNGRYENPWAGMVIREINIEGVVNNDKLILEKITAKDSENGAIQAKGQLLFKADEKFPYGLELVLKNNALIRSDNYTLTTDANLTLSGSLEEAVLAGSFKIRGAELHIPARLPTEIHDLDVIEINDPRPESYTRPAEREKTTDRLKLDIDIDAPGRVFVRGRGLDSEWKGKLHITGSVAEASINGDISVVRGKYNFFGKTFSLSKGVISFDGQSPPAPEFNVIGEHRRSDITTRINISGTPSAPEITIDSDPPLPRDEILSRLLFGRGSTSITPFQALGIAQAANALRGGDGGGVMDFFDRTRKLLGVDQLDIKQPEENGGGTALSAGKYIGKNIYLEVEQGLGPESGKVSVEVEVTPNITVDSEVGVDSRGGAGINWKWDY